MSLSRSRLSRSTWPPSNGVDGETGDYLFPELTPDEVESLVRGPAFPPEHLADLRWRAWRDAQSLLGMVGDPKDLSQAGWGVLFPAGGDPAIRQALAPLLARRQEQAGERFCELLYHPGESKLLFLARHGAGPGVVDPRQLPYYLLIVGSPAEISFEFQYQLDVQYAVGRLHFDGDDRHERYARYAQNVLRAEGASVPPPRRVVLFGSRAPGDRATELTHDHLVLPLARELSDRLRAGLQGWEIPVVVLGPDARKERLLLLLRGEEPTSLLFTATHGVGFPKDHARQRAAQGALLCAEWTGPKGGISPDFYVSAQDDLTPSCKQPGRIVFHFACYSAGTPALNDFAHRGPQEPPTLAAEPFLASLPQHLLGKEGGVLAVVGHVDRAWGYSFQWPLAGPQIQVFAGAFQSLLEGAPIGAAMEFFNQRYAELAADDLGLHPGDLLDPLALKTALLDARNYVVLGDPAVRLPAAARLDGRPVGVLV